jgi:hypothetical protein
VNTLFLVAMIIEAIFGIGLLVAPGPMMAPMGVTLDLISTNFARLFGSALISFPILLWFARKSDQMDFKKGVVYGMFAYYLISGVLLLMAQLAGQTNAMGWGLIGIHAVLLVWFGTYIFK